MLEESVPGMSEDDYLQWATFAYNAMESKSGYSPLHLVFWSN